MCAIQEQPVHGITEATYADAVAVLPAYARGVAAEMRALWQPELEHGDADSPVALATLRSQQGPPPVVDAAALDAVLCRALKVGRIADGCELIQALQCMVNCRQCMQPISMHSCGVGSCNHGQDVTHPGYQAGAWCVFGGMSWPLLTMQKVQLDVWPRVRVW